MMINKKKYIYKTYLRDVEEYEYNFFEDKINECYITTKKILNIKKPFITESSGCLINNNYYIIEVIPFKENYCMRLFVDDKKNIILYYFDITLENGFDKKLNSPYYEDLYLDVILKDNDIKILDKDELDSALERKHINEKEYTLAINTKNKLIESLNKNTNKFINIDLIKYL